MPIVADGIHRVISGICYFTHVCACVYMVFSLSVCVHAVKGKRLELSTPNLLHILAILCCHCSACIDLEVKGQGHMVKKPSQSHGC